MNLHFQWVDQEKLDLQNHLIKKIIVKFNHLKEILVGYVKVGKKLNLNGYPINQVSYIMNQYLFILILKIIDHY